MDKKKLINLIIGPILFAVCSLTMGGLFTPSGARAIGTLCWMVYWWATRPVHMTVTALLPIMINGLFPLKSVSLLSFVTFTTLATLKVDVRVLPNSSLISILYVPLSVTFKVYTLLIDVSVCSLTTTEAILLLSATVNVKSLLSSTTLFKPAYSTVGASVSTVNVVVALFAKSS